MDLVRAGDKISRVAWASGPAIFLLLISLIVLSEMDLATLSGYHFSLWQISIYEKMLHTMEVCFGVLSVLLMAQYLSARHMAARGVASESKETQMAVNLGVVLSAWLMYAIFYGLSPISPSLSVQLLLPAFLAYIVLIGLRTCCLGDERGGVEQIWKLVKKHALALGLVGGAVIFYLSFLSCSLSEWDSFNFAQALKRFDLAEHQPHPPGYALYVFLSKMALAVASDRRVALTSVSAVSGGLCLLPVFLIVKKMYDSQTAFVTCLALMSTRMYWLASEKAVTHMLGTFLLTFAVCLLYLGLEEEKFFLMSWPALGFALGARPSNFPFLGLWLYGMIHRRDMREIVTYLTLFACSLFSWLAPTILLTGWERFWELIGRQYAYVSVNEFIGARYGMQPLERLLFMLGGLISSGFGGPTHLMYPRSGSPHVHVIPSILILGVFTALGILAVVPAIKRRWTSNRTFIILWTAPYFVFVYLTSSPSYPRYFLPIIPPVVIAVVSTAWSVAKSSKSAIGKLKLKQRLLFALVGVLIVLNFLHSTRLAATIHTTEVPMVRLTGFIRNNYRRNTAVIVFHEYEAFEYHLSGYRYLSAQYDRPKVIEILESLSKKNETVLVTDTSIRYVLGSTIERLGLRKVEVARFEMDPQVETEQHIIVLYELQPARPP